jgi:ATP-dependent RNA helicase DeaD
MPPDEVVAAPPPTFDVLKLSAEVRKAVDELGYVHPTPVQRAVFDPVTRGVDLVVQARTGTGKTAAYGLPLVDSVIRRSVGVVQALVLCPTRELALQVSRELEALAKYRGTKIAPVYGGAPMPRQVQMIQDGAQIVAGTPGRVLDHLRRGTLDTKGIRAVVLDESDEMLSMGFLPQIDEILSYLPQSLQTLLFSATLPPDVQRLAESRLKTPEFITLSGDHIGALEIRHFVYMSRGDKIGELVQLIETENPESAIVFCNTRDSTKRVAQALEQQGYDADWLNADLTQAEREKVMAATRTEKLRFLVATDVAARGIDISHLTHVINYDFPESAEQYVHRTGRTGRAGKTGTAISLIEPTDIGNLYYLRLTYKIRPLERQLPTPREMKTRAEMDVVQMFADLFSKQSAHPDDLALGRRIMTHENAERIVAGLLRDHLGARPSAADQAAAARRAAMPRPTLPSSDVAGPAAPAAPAAAPVVRAAPAVPAPRVVAAPPLAAAAPVAAAAPAARIIAAAPAVRVTPTANAFTAPDDLVDPIKVPSEGNERRRSSEAGTVPPIRRRRPDGEPPRAAAPRERERDRDRDRDRDQDRDEDRKEPERPRSPDAAELFVNVGRKDGAKASDFYTVLKDRAGVTIDDTDYVNVRQRHTFIGLRRELVERVLGALNGAVIAGREAAAEPSRTRS